MRGFAPTRPVIGILTFLVMGALAQPRPVTAPADSGAISDSTETDSLSAPPPLPDGFGSRAWAPHPGSAFSLEAAPRTPFTYRPPAFSETQPYRGDFEDFQGSTAFLMNEFDREKQNERVQPEYGNTAFMVPVLPLAYLALYGTYKGAMALKGDPPIDLDSADVRILERVWAHPDIRADSLYRAWFQNETAPMTYLSLEARLEAMRRETVLIARTDGDGHVRYAARWSRTGLLQRLDAELRTLDGELQAGRFARLEAMKRLLSDATRSHLE